jgi:hypothetical protein
METGMRGISVLSLLLLTALACERRTVSAPLDLTLAKTGSADVHSRALLLWDDSLTVNGSVTAAGIKGDARNRFGQLAPTANEYQGDFCGVRGFIYDQKGESGNLEVDPDTYYNSTMSSACGAPRSMSFFLGGQGTSATIAAPHILGTPVWTLAAGEVRLVAQRFGMQGTTSCGELDFSSAYKGSSNARLTRLADGTDSNGAIVRRWRLESQGNHTAACVTMQSNGKFVDSGLRFYLPFGVSITQVRYPSPTYP